MRYRLSIIITVLISTPIIVQGSTLSDAIEGISHKGELRLGAVRSKDSENKKATTLSLGGRVSIETKPISGVSLVGTFFTTNALFGKNKNGMFLDSQNRSYSIVGESYLKANLGQTTIKAGRQIIDTPFADSDDIRMIPNSFEGYTLVNQDIQETTVILALLDKYSGIDAPIPEKFCDMQSSKDAVFTAGLLYEGLENSTIGAWHYEFESVNFNYGEFLYETDSFNMGLQYADQENSNSVYGLSIGSEINNLALNFAYNRVDGTVSNGFGGGPFFTSSEDHTIADIEEQEATSYSLEYTIDKVTVGAFHIDLEKGEDETDYLLSLAINKNHTLDMIYSDMYDDGNMVRFFANYKF